MKDKDKKVLIVTYYWPPSGGSGVQRWLKFVKYLPQFGWEPYVFTPQNPSFPITDESLERDVPDEAEVIRFPIWEPYESFNLVSKVFGEKKQGNAVDYVSPNNPSLFKKTTTWLRGNVFVPDPRIFWVKPSVKFLQDFLKDNRIDTIITTGPPHSMHLIGYRLKKKMPAIRWMADFRDPWSQWGLLDSLKVSDVVRTMHRRLEMKVLKTADVVATITPFYVRQFQSLGNREVRLLTNGFDEDDFKNVVVSRSDKFILRHVGIINEKCDPRSLVDALEELIVADKSFATDLKLEFIGEVNSDFRKYVDARPLVAEVTTFTRTIPHSKLLETYGSSSLLLLVLAGYKDSEGYMPGKLFEYLATGLPVLGIGPENGDAAKLLAESNTGVMISPEKKEGIISQIRVEYEKWKRRETGSAKRAASKYSRRSVTGELVKILEAR